MLNKAETKVIKEIIRKLKLAHKIEEENDYDSLYYHYELTENEHEFMVSSLQDILMGLIK